MSEIMERFDDLSKQIGDVGIRNTALRRARRFVLAVRPALNEMQDDELIIEAGLLWGHLNEILADSDGPPESEPERPSHE